MINTLIIDDEKRCIETLRILLSKQDERIHILDTADSVESGLRIVEKHTGRIDIVFLDIQMPDGDGFSLLKKLKNIDFRIIFTTAYDQYAINAIKFSALDYLLKPIANADLSAALSRYISGNDNGTTPVNHFRNQLAQSRTFEKLAIPTLTDISFIELNNIEHLESDKNYTTLYLSNGQKIISSKNIGYYEELLAQHGFCRIHNSYIVNISKVKRYIRGRNGLLELNNGIKLEVSGSRKDELFKILSLQ